MANKKVYWKGLEQLRNDTEFVKNADKEFPYELPIKDAYGDNTGGADEGNGSNRRDFLKMMGFSVAAVSLASCEAPVKKAIPWLVKPENIDPGVPNYYASTFVDGSDYCPVIVKTREGRPIKVEGNTFSAVTKGGTSARAQASVLGLYDVKRERKPRKGGAQAEWSAVDGEIRQKLGSATKVRVVSNTVMSPSAKMAFAAFKEAYPSAQHVQYDQESAYGIAKAHAMKFGKAMVPSFDFERANVVVSFGADFLEGWLSPLEISKQYAERKRVSRQKTDMNRHYQFEARMSLTGSNADYRQAVKASQEGMVIAALHDEIAQARGGETLSAGQPPATEIFAKAVKDLKAAPAGSTLVVSGSNDPNVQLLVANINDMLGNYGSTIDSKAVSFQKQGDDEAMADFVNDLEGGSVDAVIFMNCNPVYDHPMGGKIAAALPNVSLSVSTSTSMDETATACQYNCPNNHYLESWGDVEAKKGFFSVIQPTINPVFDTRQAEQSLRVWAGQSGSYADFVRANWMNVLHKYAEGSFVDFWNRSLHDGVFEPVSADYVSVHESTSFPSLQGAADGASMMPTMSAIASSIRGEYVAEENGQKELVVYTPTVTGSGSMANNPWLHETPDPVSKVCWGNYVSVSLALAKTIENLAASFENEHPTVTLTVEGADPVELPCIVQPGQADNTISVALGYGRGPGVGKVAQEAGGVNAYPMLRQHGGTVRPTRFEGVSIAGTGKTAKVAQVQTYHTFMGRETIIQETTLDEYSSSGWKREYQPKIETYSGAKQPADISVWDVSKDGFSREEGRKSAKEEQYEEATAHLWANTVDRELGIKTDVHQYPLHHWGMQIDLNTCTGCSACMVACHMENNVPVVGKQEIINRREMHWLRIDRYYSSAEEQDIEAYGAQEKAAFQQLEYAALNPDVVFQPMMCQHCNNAPCETVCPVAATTHSSEGLNQMTYNRCVGTKYCANNCPYKVRRFNWFKYNNNDEFDYHMNNDLGKMVLNPDVTVRSRGVMEKCSLCVQRIQSGKLKAKREGRPVQDGDVQVACAQACPTNAITFGDLNDENSAIRKSLQQEIKKDEGGRAYHVLEEINVNPNVWYLTKVRNKDKKTV